MTLRGVFPKLQMPEGMIKVYAEPPANPDDCVFALDDDLRVGGLQAADFALPVRRQP